MLGLYLYTLIVIHKFCNMIDLQPFCVATHSRSSLTTHIIALAKTIHRMFKLYELHINNKHAPLETHGVSLTILTNLV